MPNHVHLLLWLHDTTINVSTIINQLKGIITRRNGQPVWQKSFFDHIIRNEQNYSRILEYIENNPSAWHEDEYYTPNEQS